MFHLSLENCLYSQTCFHTFCSSFFSLLSLSLHSSYRFYSSQQIRTLWAVVFRCIFTACTCLLFRCYLLFSTFYPAAINFGICLFSFLSLLMISFFVSSGLCVCVCLFYSFFLLCLVVSFFFFFFFFFFQPIINHANSHVYPTKHCVHDVLFH